MNLITNPILIGNLPSGLVYTESCFLEEMRKQTNPSLSQQNSQSMNADREFLFNQNFFREGDPYEKKPNYFQGTGNSPCTVKYRYLRMPSTKKIESYKSNCNPDNRSFYLYASKKIVKRVK